MDGHRGSRTRDYCQRLCQEQIIDFLPSDAHSASRRPPRIQEALTAARGWRWDLTPMVTLIRRPFWGKRRGWS
jgi:tyrosine-protein phosphatase YwqE